MKNRWILSLLLILALYTLTGCQASTDEPFVGGTWSGALNEETAGSRLDFTVTVENEGDPVGIDFRGILTQGSIKLQLVDAAGEMTEEWEFTDIGSFALNTTLYPSPGSYQYGIAWDGPVTLAQFSMAWKPHPIEIQKVSALALLPGIGMIVVAVGFVIFAAVRRLGWGYLGLGALGWGITVALKFAWALPVNRIVYAALTSNLPEAVAHIMFYVYVGALTGVFEVAIVWLALRYTKLGHASWDQVFAFGMGFGAVESLLLGISSLISATVALAAPATLPLSALEQVALTNNLLYGVSPIWERFFVVLVHLFTNVLLFYGTRKRQSRWFWLAFVYKTGIDTVAAFAQFWGLNTLGRIWFIEAIVAMWGIAGWFGTRILQARAQHALVGAPDCA